MHSIPVHRQAANTDLDLNSRRFRWGPYLLMAICLCILVPLTAAGEPAVPKAKSVNELKAFFQQNCVWCHGLDGSGHDPHGRQLGPLDFSRVAQAFSKLSGPASEREIRNMVRTIRKGLLFGNTMPSWGHDLSQEDAALMIREVLFKAVNDKAIEPEPEQVNPQVESATHEAAKVRSVDELKVLFQQNCTKCHGLDGSGLDPQGKRLSGTDFTQVIRKSNTLSGPASERRVRSMIRTIQRGSFFYSMPSWRGTISKEEATLMVRKVLLKAERGKVIEPGVVKIN